MVLSEEFLAQGEYFQYQLARVLADGTLVAARLGVGSTTFLTVADGRPSLTSIARTFLSKTDDGRLVYGFDLDGAVWSADPVGGDSAQVDWFEIQGGARYQVGLTASGVAVELPDIGVAETIPLTASNGPGAVHGLIEVATGADGVIHLLFLGISESDESTQLAGYATIAADGTVSPMEPMIDPFTPADPGSPGHLGVAYGSSTPWLMVVGEEGVEVYLRG